MGIRFESAGALEKQRKVKNKKGHLATIWQHLINLIELFRITEKGLTDFLKSVGPFHMLSKGEALMTAGGGCFIRAEVIRNKR